MIDRLNAALEGRYRVERELGEGGMATVYLAQDVKHARRVALKVLRPELAAVVGADRFLAEIETTANLQHPHILPLFDSGEADGFLFYVMPYVEGESLREKLDREKQLRVEEAVGLTRKVADALDYAHDKGVVHRDVKPGNVLLSERGEPLVADFGIALAISQAGQGRITETGLSLGTPHYMSPEQATGDRDVDPRSDVYALGCVLYEMLAGEPPFAAPTAQGVLARILTEDARSVTEVRRTVPTHVAAVLDRALEKLPADRFDSAGTFKAALEDERFRYEPVRAGAPVRGGGRAIPPRARLSRPFGIALALALTAVVVAVAALWPDDVDPVDAASSLPAWRFEIQTELFPENGIAIAPNGTLVLPTESAEGGLRIRLPGETRLRSLQGTEDGWHPTVSPDGQWVAFTTGGELRKVPIQGGPAVVLARTPDGSTILSPHWGPGGTIAFTTPGGLYRVPDVGGTAEQVYEPEEGRMGLTPLILPEGAGWLFTEGDGFTPSDPTLMHLEPSTGETRTVAASGGSPVWLPTGDVAFVHPGGSLFAAPFDLAAAEFTAEPAPVVDSVRVSYVMRPFMVSGGGTAAYLVGGGAASDDGRIMFVNAEDGTADRPPLEPASHWDGRFSPDGSRMAYTRGLDQIRVFDLELGTNLRLTTEGSDHHDPVWSPDGTRIAFGSERDTTGVDLWVKSADGQGAAEPLLRMENSQFPREWTEDGTLVFTTMHAGNVDIYTIPADGSGEPRPYLRADWNESLARVSPDGRWLAYVSGDTDPSTIVVRSFPDPGRAFRVTEPGEEPAGQPHWSPDGRTLYYRQGAAVIMAAEVTTDPEFQVISRRKVTEFFGELRDVHPDGERLLTFQFGPQVTEESAPTRIMVVANWFSELTDRLGRARER